MTDHANCQPEAWAAAARVTRELREAMERLEKERDQLKEINDRMAEDRLRIVDQRDGFQKMMNSAVSAGVVIDGERLDALREVERLQGIVEAARKALFEDAALSDNHRLTRLTNILGTGME